MCAQGRPDETEYGVRFFAGEVADAYLQRANIQRGYCDRHLARAPRRRADGASTGGGVAVLARGARRRAARSSACFSR